MTADTRAPDIAILDRHDEPTVLEVDLGLRLGMARPTDIRRTIRKNIEELQSYGPLRSVRAMVDLGSGAQREVTEYHLTEPQALCLCQLSRAPRAAEIRRMLIMAFIQWRQGHGPGPVEPERLGSREKLAMVREARQAYGQRAARQMWMEMGLPTVPAMVEPAATGSEVRYPASLNGWGRPRQ